MTGRMDRTKSKTMMKWMLVLLMMFGVWMAAGSFGRAASADTYTVRVETGYLALRTAQAYDYRNEIGKLYTGDTVEVEEYGSGDYWYVYSAKLNKYGYVNNNYLYYSGITGDTDYTVSVATGYLALRTEKAYDYRNEIGKLYTGDTVEVIDSSDSGYWYVYSCKLDKYGYVNKDYLIAPVTVSGPKYYVTGTTYYLALRNAKAYDAANEIGKLHNGDYVYVQNTSDSTYWYVYAPQLNKYGYVNKNYLR